MTHVFVGFHDQRNSSRVLKPPGGGTSNIFGGDIVPDVIPHSPRKDVKHRESSIQEVLKTESVSTIKSEETTTTSNVVRQEEQKEEQTVAPPPDVISCKIEQMTIEKKTSSKSEVSETDSDGNKTVVASEEEHQHSCVKKGGATIGNILSQDDIVEVKKVKGASSPGQRVPPGGYSSGLW
ncbi:uncharacterized protein LOC126739000 [Anthonomus grandis grandis]|uniref:uncharacterized protein LOC126739000 n=1 Tax=Anthonomus grandis grandis TaxID=2921223 RepID=UPI002164F74F|nr:uncharacterized protein LOC126739000 [Anthonomus grandis grandis]